jgi:hypothetical protein
MNTHEQRFSAQDDDQPNDGKKKIIPDDFIIDHQCLIHKRILLLLTIFVLAALSPVYAQESHEMPARKNTIKIDLTSYWLYRNSVVFAYERVVKPNQSFAITAGYQQFPPLIGSLNDTIQVTRETSATGLKLGAEYRFYLTKENKYGAPRGVYIGPYMAYHNYMNKRSLEVINNGTPETTELKTNISITNIGFQLGYQFVLNNRWTIDLMLIGPSLSNYRFNADITGNYTFDPDKINNEVVQALINRFPAFEQLINEGEISDSGKINTWRGGYRYLFQIGYHFGRNENKRK